MITDTRLWASTPFHNRTALLDLLGQVKLFHSALAEHVARAFDVSYALYPIGSPSNENAQWMDAIYQQCRAVARALGLPPPPDLSTYDLEDEGDWAAWTYELSNYHRALSIASGLV